MEKILVGSIVLMISGVLFAQTTYEKNDLPCVAEVCLGDGLPELSGIKWDRARDKLVIRGRPNYADLHHLSAHETKALKTKYRGDVLRAGGYLATESFDQKGLPLIAKVSAACSENKLNGTFTTSSGNPTNVTISLVPVGEAATTQRWTVTTISRKFPAAVSDLQQADLRKQLKERYARFDVAKGIQKLTDGVFSINSGPGSVLSGFSLVLRDEQDRRHKSHPQCGGANKISVD